MGRRADGTERRCIVSGEVTATSSLVRFVVGPDGGIVPDVGAELPGRGIWVASTRAAVDQAARKRLFAKAAKRAVSVPENLSDRVEALLARRCLDLLGLARRAGHVVNGFEKAQGALRSGRAAVLLGARDAAVGGRTKLRRMAKEIAVVELFSVTELSLALGQENVVHAALYHGGLADRFLTEAGRLAGFRLEHSVDQEHAEQEDKT